MLPRRLLAAALVTAVSAFGFLGNEASQGNVAEVMGFGHHHLIDDAPDHCPMMRNGTMDRAQCDGMMAGGPGGMHATGGGM